MSKLDLDFEARMRSENYLNKRITELEQENKLLIRKLEEYEHEQRCRDLR